MVVETRRLEIGGCSRTHVEYLKNNNSDKLELWIF